MTDLKSPIILLGFKHVGKTTVGKLLAQELQCHFADLDDKIEINFSQQFQQNLTCRDIMQEYGEEFFLNLESHTLNEIISTVPGVIALGGGTAMMAQNQDLIGNTLLIHIMAEPQVVLNRIKASGKPAFFPETEAIDISFESLWKQRISVYENLAHITILNNDDPAITVTNIINFLKNQVGYELYHY